MKNISLQKLIRLRRVCTIWKEAIDEMCGGRDSLKLFVHEKADHSFGPNVYQYKSFYLETLDSEELERMKMKPVEQDDHLKLEVNKKFPVDQLAAFLGRLFPNVKILVLGKDVVTIQVLDLIKPWPNLTSLTLCGSRLREGYNDDLIYIIDSLEHLRDRKSVV